MWASLQIQKGKYTYSNCDQKGFCTLVKHKLYYLTTSIVNIVDHNQGGSRIKITNCNLILDANWAPKLILTTSNAIFIEIYHHRAFRLNISDPFCSKFCHTF
jgi:hypothetical protein